MGGGETDRGRTETWLGLFLPWSLSPVLPPIDVAAGFFYSTNLILSLPRLKPPMALRVHGTEPKLLAWCLPPPHQPHLPQLTPLPTAQAAADALKFFLFLWVFVHAVPSVRNTVPSLSSLLPLLQEALLPLRLVHPPPCWVARSYRMRSHPHLFESMYVLPILPCASCSPIPPPTPASGHWRFQGGWGESAQTLDIL